MNLRRLHWLEKLQVEAAVVAALAAVYFLLWPMVRPADSIEALSFVRGGSRQIAALGAGVWILSVLCALATLSARPQSALLAVLIGTGGLSLRSGQMRTLMWSAHENIPRLYAGLIMEMLILAAVLAVAAGLVAVVRRAVAAVRPKWVWRRSVPDHDDRHSQPPCGGSFGRLLIEALSSRSGKVAPRGPNAPRAMLVRCAYCLGLALLVSAVGMILMQSAQRGQILFALLAGCGVGAFVAMRVFPTPCGFPVLAAPVLLAIATYALTAATGRVGSGAWISVPYYARALPIDWMTAGAGGAVLGFWIDQRMRDARKIQSAEQDKGDS